MSNEKQRLNDIDIDVLINDLPRAYREQTDISSMSDDEIRHAWRRFGVHGCTWEV